MIDPQRAPVRPRVLAPNSGETLLLEEEVRDLLDRQTAGIIWLTGPAGSGKTTALHHLAAVLEPCPVLLDEAQPSTVADTSQASPHALIVYAGQPAVGRQHLAQFTLAPWDDDNLVEYLLNSHPQCCGSVMARVDATDRELIGNSPALWRTVLDEMAADPTLRGSHTALLRYLERHARDQAMVQHVQWACLTDILTPSPPTLTTMAHFVPGASRQIKDLLHQPRVRIVFAAQWLANSLAMHPDPELMTKPWPKPLISTTATVIGTETAPRHGLYALLDRPLDNHATVVSLLRALEPSWTPKNTHIKNLGAAHLAGAQWVGAQLPNVNLTRANLQAADLSGANLSQASVEHANLQGACLYKAQLHRLEAPFADFSRADLSHVEALRANFVGATFSGATLNRAKLTDASFLGAILINASFRQADLGQSRLVSAQITAADFRDADLTATVLAGLPLREANFQGAGFRYADLRRCDLEGMVLPQADFARADLRGALLTGSCILGGNFHAADLRNTGLAEIDWESANLRDADLRGASFHLGSSRSGLVHSPIACEGSRTGFYTDDFEEQYYKAPEEIRKANLRGADLRGAKIDNVDFYLVDLRGALLDEAQALHVRRSGAILRYSE